MVLLTNLLAASSSSLSLFLLEISTPVMKFALIVFPVSCPFACRPISTPKLLAKMSGQEWQMNQRRQYSTVMFDREGKRSPMIGNEEAWLAANPNPQNHRPSIKTFTLYSHKFPGYGAQLPRDWNPKKPGRGLLFSSAVSFAPSLTSTPQCQFL
jgi:hypothetical protein